MKKIVNEIDKGKTVNKILGNFKEDNPKNKADNVVKKMVKQKMEFYSLILKKKINIPDSKIRVVTKKGRRFAVGKYSVAGKEKEAWRILGAIKKK